MVTRIGDAAQFARMMTAMGELQKRIQEAQTSVATGRAAQRFADIPGEAALGLSVGHDLRLLATRLEENGHALQRMQVADSAMAALSDLAERARGLLVQRLNDATGGSLPLDVEIDGMLAEIESRLNLHFGGRYLFAGSRTDTQPVAIPDPPPTLADASTYYSGDELRPEIRADEDTTIVYLPTASEDAFAGLIGALGAARDAHLNDDRAGLEVALHDLAQAIQDLADLRGEYGAKAARLEHLIETQQGLRTYFEEIFGEIHNADLPAVIARLAEDQASLEASYMTIARVTEMSLVDYLR